MPETWKAVVGFEGQYEVSDLGRVRSLDRFIPCGTQGPRRHSGRMLKPGTMKSGHQLVMLGRGNPRCVHVLVLDAFVGPCPAGQECCHYDDDPANNVLGNLRWDTRAANLADYIRNYGHHTRWQPGAVNVG